MEENTNVDLDKLAQALELMKMAKLAAMGRTRRRKNARPIIELCTAEVDLHRAPRTAVEDFLTNREPPPKKALPPRRSRRSKRSEHHAWMLEKER